MSVRSRTLRLSVAAGTVVAAAVPMLVFGAAGSAQAEPLCESVVITGTVAGHWAFQPCIPYGGNPICGIHQEVGGPAADVVVDLCIP